MKKYKKNTSSNFVLDKQTGIAMIYLKKHKRGEIKYTQEVAPGWIVDFDKDDNVLQFEILCPSKHFPKAILKLLPPEFIKL